MKKDQVKKILEIAILAGRTMLENGAETYRVEDTITRICNSRGLTVENFTIPTGIFLSCQYEGEYYPYIVRTKSFTIDLEIIAKVNAFSRRFVTEEMPFEEAFTALKDIRKTPHFSPFIYSLFGGVAGGFFTLSFKGSLLEAILAFITSFLVVSIVRAINKYVGSFVKNIIGGASNGLIAYGLMILFSSVDPNIEISNIIIGSIMPLVPGVAMTNAFRDSISGDFVAGVSKLMEAVLVAIAIALGVGIVMHLSILVTGSVL